MIQKTATFLSYLYRHHFVRYLFVGGSTFAIDFSLLFGLHGRAGVSLGIATSLAYWISIIYNFLLNRSWTFSARDKSNLRKHLLLYGILLGFNYTFTLIFVDLASRRVNYLVAKALAVAVQMTWTYVVYKNYIFTTTTAEEEVA